MASKNILLMVTGSIAAFKSCHLASKLTQAGHKVQVVASPSALQFVGAATWEGLTGLPVVSDLWTAGRAMDHIHLVRWADLIIAAPATAHFINRIANGVGDDLLTNMFLAHDFKKPFLLAPAMNTSMYLNPITQRSIKTLREIGLEVLESESGVLACGENGQGRLLEPELILKRVLAALGETAAPSNDRAGVKPIANVKVLITSGGTKERIDDVRAITNTSTGRTGAALASMLYDLGYDVTVVGARGSVHPTAGVPFVEYVSYEDLESTLRKELDAHKYTHVIQAAAISDYKVAQVIGASADHKIPSGQDVTIKLTPYPKMIANLKEWSSHKDIHIAGFKLTSGATAAERKAASDKVLAHAELVVGNDLSEIRDGAHPFTVYSATSQTPVASVGELVGVLSDWFNQGGSR